VRLAGAAQVRIFLRLAATVLLLDVVGVVVGILIAVGSGQAPIPIPAPQQAIATNTPRARTMEDAKDDCFIRDRSGIPYKVIKKDGCPVPTLRLANEPRSPSPEDEAPDPCDVLVGRGPVIHPVICRSLRSQYKIFKEGR
jgi:hypothetical protein